MKSKEQFLIQTKKVLFGTSWKHGILLKIVLYALLILFGFVFIFPLIHMLSYSFMSPSDIVNPFVNYLPTKLYLENFTTAFEVLDFFPSLIKTLMIAVIPSILQCVSTSLIGYGLARFKFPCKTLILVLVMFTFIIPTQTTMIPQLLIYTGLGMDNIMAFIIPALFGQGLKSAIFIFIFFQFFSSLPKSLEEAAKIDGAGVIKIFVFIAVPLAISAFVLTFLFSFVWYFNETTLTSLFLGESFKTLPLKLSSFLKSFEEMNPGQGGAAADGKNINEAIYMAGTLISILPLLIIYFATQKLFVESVDKAGITGE